MSDLNKYVEELEERCEKLEDEVDHAIWSHDNMCEVLLSCLTEMGRMVVREIEDRAGHESHWSIPNGTIVEAAKTIAHNINCGWDQLYTNEIHKRFAEIVYKELYFDRLQ